MEPSSADLRYFLEVTREGNMSKAARKLGISQPSLSLAIQRIEKGLGEQVLLRDRTGASPTRAGELLLKKVHKILSAWDEVRDVLKERQGAVKGELVLGCHAEVAIDSLPLFMPSTFLNFPDLAIKLEHDFSRNITQQVIDGKIDVGIVVNPRLYPDLVIKTLSYDEMGLFARKSDKNAKSFEAILYQPDIPQSHRIIRAMEKKGLSFKRSMTSIDLEVICSLVASGCGAGILSAEVATRNPNYNLVMLKDSPTVKDRVAVVYRQENRNSKLVQALVNEIVKGHQAKYGVL